MKRLLAAALVLVALAAAGSVAAAADGQTQFAKAKAAYLAFLKEDGKKVYRHNWVRHIDQFRRLHKAAPKAAYADDALFLAASAYLELHAWSGQAADAKQAVTIYDQLLKGYPKSPFADDALVKSGAALEKLNRPAEAQEHYARCVKSYPKGDLTLKAREGAKRLAKHAAKPPPTNIAETKPPAAAPSPSPSPGPVGTPAPDSPVAQPGEPAAATPVAEAFADGDTIPLEIFTAPTIVGVQNWTNPDYTRIVIELSDETPYTTNLLEQQPGQNLPRRLYIDFRDCGIASAVAKEMPLADGLLQRVRVGQFDEKTARVVLDIESIENYQIFPMLEPFRIVIDVQGRTKTAATPTPPPDQPKPKKTFLVVLDAGHGGKDTGAMSRGGDRESLLTLSIVKRVEKELKKDAHIRTLLSRPTDHFITLPQRPAIANKANADLFVSVHINAARNVGASGIETFHFSPKANREDWALVAAENATAEERVEQMNAVLAALSLSYKKVESNHLAALVQKNMLTHTRRMHSNVVSRPVRSAPFYVLLGAKMPAILVECGFITNKTELARLKSDAYQDALAKGIADGIREYLSGYQ
ncbi:MAG: N-acetylmuramoyl-L-alanine amidase [Deltaproteobacteria bacterium]|nr:N-acetylmuramoyl-L-alanine amidase [Deltaproteobacteria bacterium]